MHVNLFLLCQGTRFQSFWPKTDCRLPLSNETKPKKCKQNGMRRKASKYQAIVMGKSQVIPRVLCENTAFDELQGVWKCGQKLS